ncbi:MAG TPA: ATP-binding cassette domain-containing protein [Candidatus Krumholzibacteria bacterium]|nr:ATP-binding cassette domain-containing protein [Candidatus Krumholzibacteria bacterium]HPD71342.1 ATP-binding cassette domain-containing protein [Candidatus Krumholzibacteria bacterium]HRY38958.1 ATP-binding cassette domain-containing protein [Candidatus Krumholzibacteria bacterium]
MAGADLLAVRDLRVRYAGAPRPALAGLDIDVAAGECVALVGPSGCGKSTLCRTILDLLPDGARWSGSIRWEGRELAADRRFWHGLRGRGVGLVLQDHRHSLDPVRRVGAQVAEVLRRHRRDVRRRDLPAAVAALLGEVRLPDPERLMRRYPHQLSGGQRQRVCLAAALAAQPRLLLADEPTTALDLIVQQEIVDLLADLVRRRRLGLLLVTHDRELVPLIADRIVEVASGAGESVARGAEPPSRGDPAAPVCLAGRGLAVAVRDGARWRPIVHPIDLTLRTGWALGLAGESGAGKTTLARALAGWLPLASGSLSVAGAATEPAAAGRRAVQLVSQDPAAALDPRQPALAAVVEAARAAGDAPAAARERALALFAEVDLDVELARRRPHALSGGQRQRVQLARALAARPRVLVADEPASSLDSARRDRLLELLRRAQRQHGLALLLISHDLALLERWCDEVAVLLDGHLVELFRPGLVDGPRHPFATDLAAAAPANLARRATGGPLLPIRPATDPRSTAGGCPYAHRCRLVQPACRAALPPLRESAPGHHLRCPEVDRQAR